MILSSLRQVESINYGFVSTAISLIRIDYKQLQHLLLSFYPFLVEYNDSRSDSGNVYYDYNTNALQIIRLLEAATKEAENKKINKIEKQKEKEIFLK